MFRSVGFQIFAFSFILFDKQICKFVGVNAERSNLQMTNFWETSVLIVFSVIVRSYNETKNFVRCKHTFHVNVNIFLTLTGMPPFHYIL